MQLYCHPEPLHSGLNHSFINIRCIEQSSKHRVCFDNSGIVQSNAWSTISCCGVGLANKNEIGLTIKQVIKSWWPDKYPWYCGSLIVSNGNIIHTGPYITIVVATTAWLQAVVVAVVDKQWYVPKFYYSVVMLIQRIITLFFPPLLISHLLILFLLPLSVSNVVIVQMLWHVLLTVKHSSILETKEMACRNIPLEDADATSHRPNLLLLLLLLCSTCSSIVVITIIIIFNSRHVSNWLMHILHINTIITIIICHIIICADLLLFVEDHSQLIHALPNHNDDDYSSFLYYYRCYQYYHYMPTM